MPRHALFLLALLLAPQLAMAAEPAPVEAKLNEPIPLFDGNPLHGWAVADTADFPRHGEVKVHEGTLALGIGGQGTGIRCTKKDLPRTNYEIRLEAMRTEGRDFFCGLTLPVGESYVSYIVGGWGGGTIGFSNIDGLSADENATSDYIEFEEKTWYKIRVRVTDHRLSAWINGEQKADVAREGREFGIWWEQEPLRPLGIATWNTAARLRNIELVPLPPPAAEEAAD